MGILLRIALPGLLRKTWKHVNRLKSKTGFTWEELNAWTLVIVGPDRELRSIGSMFCVAS